MGNDWSCVLPEGGATRVGELLRKVPQFVATFREVSLTQLHNFAGEFARRVSSVGDADLDYIVAKSITTAYLTTRDCFTKRQFLTCCRNVAGELFKRINGVSAPLAANLKAALKKVLEGLSKVSISPTIANFFKDVLKEEAACTGSATLQAARAVTSATAEEVLENIPKLTKASQSAKSALKFGFLVDGAVAVATIGYAGYKYHNGEIDGKEFKRTTIRRSSGAVGSVGMSAAGTFVGTLLFPGVGTFIGGVVGGIAGDYTGSWFGGKIDDNT